MKIFADVVEFCHGRLLKDADVMEYLQQKRGLSLHSITKFQLGLFPQDLRELFEIADPKKLRSAGIIRHASASPFIIQDLVMPIRNVYGNYIALAGRTRLSETEREKKGVPKYKNSIYKKSHHLFGLNFAKRSIIQNDVAYIVEGYFDVITPHQKGLENVIATCGAFLTTRHMVLLSRYTTNIVLIMDNEENAQNNARKIIERKGREGINLSLANPLEGTGAKDVDEYLRHHSVGELTSRLKSGENYDNIKPFWD